MRLPFDRSQKHAGKYIMLGFVVGFWTSMWILMVASPTAGGTFAAEVTLWRNRLLFGTSSPSDQLATKPDTSQNSESPSDASSDTRPVASEKRGRSASGNTAPTLVSAPKATTSEPKTSHSDSTTSTSSQTHQVNLDTCAKQPVTPVAPKCVEDAVWHHRRLPPLNWTKQSPPNIRSLAGHAVFDVSITNNGTTIVLGGPSCNGWNSNGLQIQRVSGKAIVKEFKALPMGACQSFNIRHGCVMECAVPSAIVDAAASSSSVEEMRHYLSDLSVSSGSSGNAVNVNYLPEPPKKYYLTAVVLCRRFKEDLAGENFPRYREFLEYYRFHGVEHFYVYDNAEDPSEALTQEFRWYIDRGLVTYEPWYMVTSKFGYPISQSVSYNHVLHKYRHQSTWMIQVDFDEYMFPVKDETVVQFLQKREPREGQNFAGLKVLCWFFGSDVVNETDSTRTMMETYIRRADRPITGGREKVFAWLAGTVAMEVHMIAGGPVINVSPDEMFMAHYWKNRGGKMNNEQFDQLATRYGRTIWKRMEEVATQQQLPVWGGPWPLDVYM